MSLTDSAVDTVLDDLVEAWNAGDAERFGALFAPDATYVTYLGIAYQGRDAITRAHRQLFATHLKGVRLAQQIVDRRQIGPDVVVAISRGDTYKGDPPRRLRKAQTQVLTRRDDRWEVAAFQNTARHRLLAWLTARNPDTAGNLGPKAG
ncbi:SgcJ/EcaC family oxidoreductase [Epidermidibacterium keratini]|uniref:SgcJ/EcaC family oxidoreductase n=1 Tax=Epidermidibacterium keratini TaxID=1891644 RepID=A0A7L4YPW2_9ACTN|nr:SgcJ/EcaC family oxidoreductase [Epidermidibacterium keratini]QHC00829.1 SgcJ/EcaC family oxidoreductase [Epidermidibacterium keratini]